MAEDKVVLQVQFDDDKGSGSGAAEDVLKTRHQQRVEIENLRQANREKTWRLHEGHRRHKQQHGPGLPDAIHGPGFAEGSLEALQQGHLQERHRRREFNRLQREERQGQRERARREREQERRERLRRRDEMEQMRNANTLSASVSEIFRARARTPSGVLRAGIRGAALHHGREPIEAAGRGLMGLGALGRFGLGAGVAGLAAIGLGAIGARMTVGAGLRIADQAVGINPGVTAASAFADRRVLFARREQAFQLEPQLAQLIDLRADAQIAIIELKTAILQRLLPVIIPVLEKLSDWLGADDSNGAAEQWEAALSDVLDPDVFEKFFNPRNRNRRRRQQRNRRGA